MVRRWLPTLCTSLLVGLAGCESQPTLPSGDPEIEAPSAAATISGTYGTLDLYSPTTLNGNLTAGTINIHAGGSLNVGARTVTAGTMNVWSTGSLIMRHTSGQLHVGTVMFHQTESPNYSDGTLISAGLIRITGQGNTGGVPRASGTNRIVVAGRAYASGGPQSFSAISVQDLDIASADSASLYGGVMTIRGSLRVLSGTLLTNAGQIHVRGAFATAPGATLRSGATFYTHGALDLQGGTTMYELHLLHGTPVTVPTGPNIDFERLWIANGTRAVLDDALAVDAVVIWDRASLSVGPHAVHANHLTVGAGSWVIMRHAAGTIVAPHVSIGSPGNGGGPNITDATLLSAGTIRITGDNSVVASSSGTHRTILAGSTHQNFYTAGTLGLQHLDIENPVRVTLQLGSIVKGHLRLLAGELTSNSTWTLRPSGVLTASAGTRVTGTIALRGRLAGSGTFAPYQLYLRHGTRFDLPGGTNYQYERINVEDGTAVRTTSTTTVAEALTVAPGSSFQVRHPVVVQGVASFNGKLIMRHAGGTLNAEQVFTGAPNANDSTALSAGVMRLTGGSLNTVHSSSGGHRVVLQGSTAQQLDGGRIQNLDVRNPTTTTLYVDRVKGTLQLHAGRLVTTETAHVGTLLLNRGTTLDSTTGGLVYHTHYERRRATIIGTAPVAAP